MVHWFDRWRKPKTRVFQLTEEMLVKEASRSDLWHWIGQSKCPDCHNSHLVGGPEGGFSKNYACAKCGSEFNVSPPLGWVERTSVQGNPDAVRLRAVYGIIVDTTTKGGVSA